MQFRIPKSDKYFWTKHAKFKMRQYGLSPQRVIRVIRNPQRTEEGVVKNTIAVMQPASVKYRNFKKIWSQEIWAMYQIKNQNAKIKDQNDLRKSCRDKETDNSKLKANKLIKLNPKKLKIISAWRYPGVSPKNNPIPEEILEEMKKTVVFRDCFGA